MTGGAATRLRFTALVVAAVTTLIPRNAASGPEDGYLDAAEVLPGQCFPAVVLEGQRTDCRFPLARTAPLDPAMAPHVALLDPRRADFDLASTDCLVIGDELVCRDIPAPFGTLGERRVTPVVSDVAAATHAVFVVESIDRQPVTVFSTDDEPYVFPGSPLRIWTRGNGGEEAVVLVVRPRDGGEPVAAVDLDGDPDEFGLVVVELPVPAGRYLVTPCVGGPFPGCDEVPGGVAVQVGSGTLREVISGWNRADADRINIVLVPSGFAGVDEALGTARLLLGWDGPLPVGHDHQPLRRDVGPGVAAAVEFGPFAIEPLRSAKGLFNLWMIDDVVADARALWLAAPAVGDTWPVPDFGLPDVAVTILHLLAPGRGARSEALPPSFAAQPGGPTTVERDGLVFGTAYLALPHGEPIAAADTLAHEWGHGLFDLRDEYMSWGLGVQHGYPNCAPDEATALEWWGGMIGDVDPFLFEYLDTIQQYGISTDPGLVDDFRVGLVAGGCYSVVAEAVRPTVESLMNAQTPVFGSVNRARVESILALWSGTAVLAHSGDLVLECVVAGDGKHAECGGTVAAFVVTSDLMVASGAGEAECEVGEGAVSDPRPVACRVVPLERSPGVTVTASVGAGSSVGSVYMERSLHPGVAKAPASAPDGGRSLPWVAIVGLLAVSAAVVAIRSRRLGGDRN